MSEREEFYVAYPQHTGILEMHEAGAIDWLDAMTAVRMFGVWKAAKESSRKELEAAKMQSFDAAVEWKKNQATIANIVAEKEALEKKLEMAYAVAAGDCIIAKEEGFEEGKQAGRDELQKIPDRWQLVPTTPTNEMLDAMDSSAWKPGNYKRMLAAAPQPPRSE